MLSESGTHNVRSLQVYEMKRKKENIAKEIVKSLQDKGYIAYYAGGCVRDKLLGIEPSDFDVATNATPEKVQKIFKKTIPVGVKFGVILVLKSGIQTEVATFRSDDIYIDGRRPVDVHFSSAIEDAQRRDFTINGMFYDPIKEKIIDYVGGKKDLKKGIICAIGEPDKRFNEDALRLIRCIRFASRFGFEIEEKTFDSVKRNIKLINKISAERIGDELIKLFTFPNAGRGLELLYESGLLKEILPEVEEMVGVNQPEEFHPEGDVFNHTKIALNLLKNPDAVLAFATLFHDIGKPRTFVVSNRIRFNRHDSVGKELTEKICDRLRFPRDVKKKIVECVDNHMTFMSVKNMRESKIKRLLSRDTFETELELHRIDCLASHGDIENYYFLKKRQEEYAQEEIEPEPLINGHNLIELGYKPGPIFKRILNRICDLQLENKLRTKEEALEYVKKHFTK